MYLGNILGNKGKTGVKVFIGSFGVYTVEYKEIFIEDVNPLMLREAKSELLNLMKSFRLR